MLDVGALRHGEGNFARDCCLHLFDRGARRICNGHEQRAVRERPDADCATALPDLGREPGSRGEVDRDVVDVDVLDPELTASACAMSWGNSHPRSTSTSPRRRPELTCSARAWSSCSGRRRLLRRRTAPRCGCASSPVQRVVESLEILGAAQSHAPRFEGRRPREMDLRSLSADRRRLFIPRSGRGLQPIPGTRSGVRFPDGQGIRRRERRRGAPGSARARRRPQQATGCRPGRRLRLDRGRS